jgi:hypothetical protein
MKRVCEDLTLTHRLIGVHNIVVLVTTSDAQTLTVLDHDKKDSGRSHANESCRDADDRFMTSVYVLHAVYRETLTSSSDTQGLSAME